jgi:dihydrolipoamide dehydrogenase
VEERDIGGTCLNRGCIPTKAMLESAHVLDIARTAQAYGVKNQGVVPDFPKMVARKNDVVSSLRAGVERLLEEKGVVLVRGRGALEPGRAIVAVEMGQGTDTISYTSLIIATGSGPMVPPVEGVNLPGVYTSDNILDLEEIPESIVVVGGGAVGLEYAGLFAALGSRVTVVELVEHLLPLEDKEVGDATAFLLGRQGVEVRTKTQLLSIETGAKGLAVEVGGTGGSEVLHARNVLLAVGRRPRPPQGIPTHNKGFLKVDASMRTERPGAFAVGDVAGNYMLAHVAMEEGQVAAENALGLPSRMNYRAVPRCVFLHPEVACVGLTEEAAAKGRDISVARFPLSRNGRAMTMGLPDGFIKVICEVRTGEILGVHMVGPAVTEMVAGVTAAISLEATYEEMATLIHPHPTVSESVKECMGLFNGKAIHC